jgi:hypothetical protein
VLNPIAHPTPQHGAGLGFSQGQNHRVGHLRQSRQIAVDLDPLRIVETSGQHRFGLHVHWIAAQLGFEENHPGDGLLELRIERPNHQLYGLRALGT